MRRINENLLEGDSREQNSVLAFATAHETILMQGSQTGQAPLCEARDQPSVGPRPFLGTCTQSESMIRIPVVRAMIRDFHVGRGSQAADAPSKFGQGEMS